MESDLLLLGAAKKLDKDALHWCGDHLTAEQPVGDVFAVQRGLTDGRRHVILFRPLEEFSLHETAAIGKLRNVLESREMGVVMCLPRVQDRSTALPV